MIIERINTYCDERFSQKVLNQHGCYLVNGEPYEVEILSERKAAIRGRDTSVFPHLIEEFRFYAPHITHFTNDDGVIMAEYPPVRLITLELGNIQPSQFYVDSEKIDAAATFLSSEKDIITQVLKHGNRYVSLDGHSRLYYAVVKGWKLVRAVEISSADYIFAFVEEAKKRNIHSPYDLQQVSHLEYEIKWNQFCDTFLSNADK